MEIGRASDKVKRMTKEQAARLLGVTVEEVDSMGPTAFEYAEKQDRLIEVFAQRATMSFTHRRIKRCLTVFVGRVSQGLYIDRVSQLLINRRRGGNRHT